ncbi:hypothetical protein A5742_21320 [Mycolicibacterium fortuitum]|uniref:Uncharacterized protein n=1 Tax=Mycolicibacterium fortuitum TaxID=1766 RepID=A0ABD6QQK5_MYCFO|nr:hypothetical protein A5742_21320 [Mycolicibacterium fortuitum]
MSSELTSLRVLLRRLLREALFDPCVLVGHLIFYPTIGAKPFDREPHQTNYDASYDKSRENEFTE